jgi:glycosyltransferase involved in cell wall biosynthesis
MKILLATSSYLPVLGGLQEAVSQLAHEYARSGHTVRVVANRYPSRLSSQETIDGVPVVRMLFPGLYLASNHPIRIMKFLSGLLVGAINFFRLLILLFREKPDVINCHFLGGQSSYFLYAAKLLRIRLVISMHGNDVEGLPYRSRLDRRRFENVLKQADHVTACSCYLLEKAQKLVPEIAGKSTAIWNGIQPDEFSDAIPYQHQRPYLFAAGRLVHKKGFDVFLKAYHRLLQSSGEAPDLILAGDGPELDALRALTKELSLPLMHREDFSGGGVLFWGRASRDEMKSLLSGCELFVVPSRLEPFGIVAMEALASTTPLVASRVGGLVELAEEYDFSLVDPDNPTALADEISRLISSPKKRTSAVCSLNTWEDAAEKYLNTYLVG